MCMNSKIDVKNPDPCCRANLRFRLQDYEKVQELPTDLTQQLYETYKPQQSNHK
jgi:hypothetical protein